MPGINNSRDNDSESLSVRSATPDSECDWVQETLRAAEQENRTQPWKKTFGDSVNNRFDDSPDLVAVEKSIGGVCDPACPFRTQGSSLAA